ncbi:MAG: DUF126 domain-containing protein [Hyphomicrobiales bacterium]|nr:DUF126 domain-containing protein [Hyphomicrobiales bacterium]
MAVRVAARVLLAGRATGPLKVLGAPISFWGGVAPETGRIVLPGHPDLGHSVAGTVLALPGTVGSSSASAVLLELLYRGLGPAALVLAAPDAILALGAVVAREMGYATIPVVQCPLDALPQEGTATIAEDGVLTVD